MRKWILPRASRGNLHELEKQHWSVEIGDLSSTTSAESRRRPVVQQTRRQGWSAQKRYRRCVYVKIPGPAPAGPCAGVVLQSSSGRFNGL